MGINWGIHTIVASFDTMIFCRMMLMATASGAESRNVQQVEGRNEGKDGEDFW